MFYIVTGGSASGKSEYAESLAISIEVSQRFYIATMKPWDEEGRRRIQKHRAMRAGKGFETLEIYGRCRVQMETDDQEDFCENIAEEHWTANSKNSDSAGLSKVSGDSAVLLECLSNLTANVFYDPIYADKDLAQMITEDILDLKKRVKDFIMVTNEIFSDGIIYDPETTRYMQILGQVNQNLAREADRVVEVVYGIPVEIKILL